MKASVFWGIAYIMAAAGLLTSLGIIAAVVWGIVCLVKYFCE